MIRVGVLGTNFISWGGGIDLLKRYISAMRTRDNVSAMLILPSVNGVENYKKDFMETFNDLEIFIYSNEQELVNILRNKEIDIVFPSHIVPQKDLPIPWIGYIFDFQHKYFPEFFSQDDCKMRDVYFGSILKKSNAVVVNANEVKSDIEKYFPALHNKCIYVTPFSTAPQKEWLHLEEVDITKYNLPEKYFIISNQFWVHKSHSTAFKALALLHEKYGYTDVSIVCTGEMRDYRFPKYNEELLESVKSLNLDGKIIFLGYIPKLEQMKVLQQSIALIQPTLYEGGPGGGSVEDAISIGKRAIVSNIPVNREIEFGRIRFFKAESEEDLCENMACLIREEEKLPTCQELRQQANGFKNKLGEYIEIMLEETILKFYTENKDVFYKSRLEKPIPRVVIISQKEYIGIVLQSLNLENLAVERIIMPYESLVDQFTIKCEGGRNFIGSSYEKLADVITASEYDFVILCGNEDKVLEDLKQIGVPKKKIIDLRMIYSSELYEKFKLLQWMEKRL